MFDADTDGADLKDVLFPVEMRHVFVSPSYPSNSPISLPRHCAIVDAERDHVFAVVTNGYRLVTNKEALDLAAEIMGRVFKSMRMSDMRCFNITMPGSRSFCHIDLVHAQSSFEPWEKDKWSPFLRVTNSYNRTKKLRFELGFCRWICQNGMIFGSRSIEISDAHSIAGLDRIRYDRIAGDLGSINALEAQFMGHLQNLRRYHVPPSVMPALFCKVFGVRVPPDVETKPRLVELLLSMANKLDDLIGDYFDSMGHHAYAALNVLTDFATRPAGVISAASSMHGFQVETARWMEDFLRQIASTSFDFDKYLGDWKKEGDRLMSLLSRPAEEGYEPD